MATITTVSMPPRPAGTGSTARVRTGVGHVDLDPQLRDLVEQLEAIDDELSARWRRAVDGDDPRLSTALAESARHVRHARLVLGGNGIG